MPYAFTDSKWPIVICEPIGVSTDGDIDEYIRTNEQAVARHEPHFVIVDARQGESMAAVHRRRVADWVTQNEPALRAYRVGLAFVSESALLRGVLTAIYWVRRPPYPTAWFRTLQEAEDWGNELLRQRAEGSHSRLKPALTERAEPSHGAVSSTSNDLRKLR
jgi:hypothetical protein